MSSRGLTNGGFRTEPGTGVSYMCVWVCVFGGGVEGGMCKLVLSCLPLSQPGESHFNNLQTLWLIHDGCKELPAEVHAL